jgi:hypothetical protein
MVRQSLFLKDKKHYLVFLCSDTFIMEESTYEVDSWDILSAKKLFSKESFYAFYFITKQDGIEIDRSNFYYLKGRVETIEEIRQRNNPKEAKILANMESNGWNRILINTMKVIRPLQDEDIVLEEYQK